MSQAIIEKNAAETIDFSVTVTVTDERAALLQEVAQAILKVGEGKAAMAALAKKYPTF